MRISRIYKVLALILISVLISQSDLLSQEGNTIDVEYDKVCYVDSIAPDNQVQYWKVYSHNLLTWTDKTYDLSSQYVVQGTTMPCREIAYKECYVMYEPTSLNRYKFFGYDIEGATNMDIIGIYSGSITIPLHYPYSLDYPEDLDRLIDDWITYHECIGECTRGIIDNDSGVGISTQGSLNLMSSLTLDSMVIANTEYFYNKHSVKTATPSRLVSIPDVDQGSWRCDTNYESYFDDYGNVIFNVREDGTITNKISDSQHEKRKIDCDYKIDCNRGIVSSECYRMYFPEENITCSYRLFMPSLTIQRIVINNTVINGPWTPTTGHDQLRQDIIDYLEDNEYYYDAVEVNSHNGPNTGTLGNFYINIIGTNAVFNGANNGQGYSPIKYDCRTYEDFNVSRLETTGGIVSVYDTKGKKFTSIPPNANRISCDDLGNYASQAIYQAFRTDFDANSDPTDQSYNIYNNPVIEWDSPREIMVYNVTACDIVVRAASSGLTYYVPRYGTAVISNPHTEDINQIAFEDEVVEILFESCSDVGPQVGTQDPAIMINVKHYK